MSGAAAVLEELRALGTAQNVKVYRRHGAGENLYGVSFANLEKLRKRIGTDHDLARALWASGNADARLLVCMVADPALVIEQELDQWLAEIQYYVLVDVFCRSLASRAPGARSRAERWMASESDWAGQAGWDLIAILALAPDGLTEQDSQSLLERVERELQASPNRTRHAMNNALIAIGLRSEALAEAAIEAARRIGKVVVDHGQTGCKTPEAEGYIRKSWGRRVKRRADNAVMGGDHA